MTFKLSDKVLTFDPEHIHPNMLVAVKDIKEFIRLLKEEFPYKAQHDKIDKLSGFSEDDEDEKLKGICIQDEVKGYDEGLGCAPGNRCPDHPKCNDINFLREKVKGGVK